MSDNRKGFMGRWRERLFGNRGATVPGAAPLEDPSPPAGNSAPMRGSGAPPRPAARVAADADLSNTQDRERVVRVFISSTFKDMIADRDELMAQTWPALRSLCRERSVEFVEVDLRWGITEEQSQRKETVQYCLDEIKRCRPYFIGLLGERYGWVPEAEAFPEGLLEREGWLTPEIAQRSATELEILHGVLNNPDMAGRAFFYFRDPAFSERLAAEGQIELTEHPDPKEVEKFGEAEAARRAEERRAKLADLKDRIRTLCQERGMPLRDADRYADPERLAALVLEDLTAAIEAEFPADRVPDAFAREARDHEAYAQSRRSAYYIGRDAYFERLDAYARDGADGCGLTVLGESGAGKSALLANWLGRWREAHPGRLRLPALHRQLPHERRAPGPDAPPDGRHRALVRRARHPRRPRLGGGAHPRPERGDRQGLPRIPRPPGLPGQAARRPRPDRAGCAQPDRRPRARSPARLAARTGCRWTCA